MPLTKARLRISDYSSGRKSRVKNHEKKVAQASLSLTSMVDLFTLLVVYLMLNSGELKEWVDVAAEVQLPKGAFIGQSPERGATIQVSKTTVFGDRDIPLVDVAKVAKGPFSVPEIKEFLKKQDNKNGYVNLVADYSVPFGVMRKVIASCQDAGFNNVNLAIQPIAKRGTASTPTAH